MIKEVISLGLVLLAGQALLDKTVTAFKEKPNIAISISGDENYCQGKVLKDYQEYKKGTSVAIATEVCRRGHGSGYLKWADNTGYRAIGTGFYNPFVSENLSPAGTIEKMYFGSVIINGEKYRNSGAGRDCLGKPALVNYLNEVKSCVK